jgi:hypothetical protein
VRLGLKLGGDNAEFSATKEVEGETMLLNDGFELLESFKMPLFGVIVLGGGYYSSEVSAHWDRQMRRMRSLWAYNLSPGGIRLQAVLFHPLLNVQLETM